MIMVKFKVRAQQRKIQIIYGTESKENYWPASDPQQPSQVAVRRQGWLELRLELKQNFSQDQRGQDEEIQDYIENIAKNEYFERSSLFHTHI